MFFVFLDNLHAQESDSIEIIYDTVYAADTVYQKEEITIVNQQEYVLDLSTGFSVGYSNPYINYSGDTCVSPKDAWAVHAFIPFTANFRPFIVKTGILIERLFINMDVQYRTSHYDSTTRTLIDTLDVYYVTKRGVTERHVLTSSRDTVITTKAFTRMTAQNTNTYTFIAVPLLFGYQLDKQWCTISASMGAYLSYLAWSGKKTILSNDAGIFAEKTSNLHRFFTSPAFNTQCIVPISKACDIAGGIVYRYSPISLQKDKSYNTQFQSITYNL